MKQQEKIVGDWYCHDCESYISAESVTFEETHDKCGSEHIEFIEENSTGN